MKFRICIDRVVLDGLGFSASERRAFERSFAAVLHEAIASQARMQGLASVGNRAGVETLSIGTLDAGDPRLFAGALASPLAAHVLTGPSPAKGRAR